MFKVGDIIIGNPKNNTYGVTNEFAIMKITDIYDPLQNSCNDIEVKIIKALKCPDKTKYMHIVQYMNHSFTVSSSRFLYYRKCANFV